MISSQTWIRSISTAYLVDYHVELTPDLHSCDLIRLQTSEVSAMGRDSGLLAANGSRDGPAARAEDNSTTAGDFSKGPVNICRARMMAPCRGVRDAYAHLEAMAGERDSLWYKTAVNLTEITIKAWY
ncbi:hypothetical protein OE88DRAFT_1654690 [Heliocybe sulcata]|uniref:Uncharacterized protein n=1 Tax=Heliocybe sulcata TaxID=5364 RepID=A0A5C3NCN5_9AGAM|nr:hypothetical protein OE88DRAFT_1654690 [Heliocybe sulcata]